jgi:hypothetical protein
LQLNIGNACITYLLVIKLNNTTLNHFPVQVITLTSTFSDTSKDGETTLNTIETNKPNKAQQTPLHDHQAL